MTFARLQGGHTPAQGGTSGRGVGKGNPSAASRPPLTRGGFAGLGREAHWGSHRDKDCGSSTPPHPALWAAPTIQPAQPGRAGEGTRPYKIRGTLRPFRRGRPAGGLWPRTSSATLRVTPSPKGEGFRATARVAPTVGNEPGALARKRQARERNRTSPNFPPTQAPSGAGRNRTQALLILRAGNILPTSRGNPRKWGSGDRLPLSGGDVAKRQRG